MSKAIYDAAVVGAGLFGSAAARYLSAAGLKTLIVGPAEPEDLSTHSGVFASHYDEARITRIVDPDPVWGELAARSIAEYSAIEQQSGIRFHHPAGCLRVAPLQDSGATAQQHCIENGLAQNADFQVLTAAATAQRFPYFHFAPDVDAIWERGAAGYINPRRMVEAQLTIAQNQNATLMRETVGEIIPEAGSVALVTREGRIHRARKVLLAAGAYTRFLIGDSALQIRLVQVILAEVPEPRAEMPCLIYSPPNHPELDDLYLLPPVRYPDGKWYLKIGIFTDRLSADNFDHRSTAESEAAIREWFHHEPNDDETRATKRALRELMPELGVLSTRAVPCLWLNTPQTRPVIQQWKPADDDGRVYVAAGGCGRAAKSSDAIGKLGAELLLSDA